MAPKDNNEMTVSRSAGAGHCAQCLPDISSFNSQCPGQARMRLGRQVANPDVNQHPQTIKREKPEESCGLVGGAWPKIFSQGV